MKTTTAEDVMSRHVVTVRDNMSVHELSNFLSEHMISGAPVVNRYGKLVGVVSLTDIARSDEFRSKLVMSHYSSESCIHGWEDRLNPQDFNELHIEESDGLTVKDIMTPTVYTVDVAAPCGEVARLMLTGHIHRLIVLRHGKIVGIVTSLDLLKTIADN